MTTAAWIALVFLLVSVVVSATIAVLLGLRLWRTFGTVSTSAQTALDDVTRSAAAAEEHAASLSANTEKLSRATEHLQASLAQLAVLRAAAAEANAKLNRIRRLVPSK